MSLRIIATGGTFDKHYDEIEGKLAFDSGHLPQVIRRARMTVPVQLEELPLLDSLDMNDADRQRILACCLRADEKSIIVVHGTDTMKETAEVLGAAQLPKTIVLTGAMIPYEVKNSDALFNFGFACGVAQVLAPGVYIAMNAKVFAWDKVRKNRSAGLFEPSTGVAPI
ncbi:MAG TPA: asparaginase domain-containing protein [Oxalicibacterium sp.]|jgi:L-asparaginase|nr:asparaginase domain-containing protein [Oxalicibacterium sp.]